MGVVDRLKEHQQPVNDPAKNQHLTQNIEIYLQPKQMHY